MMDKLKIFSLQTLAPILAMEIAQIGRTIDGRANSWSFGELCFFPFACLGAIAIINEIIEWREKRKSKSW
jgi:hypothetical protein